MLVICLAACSQPLKITTRSDPHTTTSGTLGSATFNNKLPEGRGDTTKLPVPPLPVNDSIPK